MYRSWIREEMCGQLKCLKKKMWSDKIASQIIHGSRPIRPGRCPDTKLGMEVGLGAKKAPKP